MSQIIPLEAPGNSPFSDLPPFENAPNGAPADVLTLVFKQLPYQDWKACRGVCRKWREVLKDSRHFEYNIQRLALAGLRASGTRAEYCGGIKAKSREACLIQTKNGLPAVFVDQKLHFFKSPFHGHFDLPCFEYVGLSMNMEHKFVENTHPYRAYVWNEDQPERLMSDEATEPLLQERIEDYATERGRQIGQVFFKQVWHQHQWMIGCETSNLSLKQPNFEFERKIFSIFMRVFGMTHHTDVLDIQLCSNWLIALIANGSNSISLKVVRFPIIDASLKLLQTP